MLRLLIILLMLTVWGRALAHESRPLTIVIEETSETRYLLTWRAPASDGPPAGGSWPR